MGTRGVIGFYKNGKEKVGYNHYDSYPTGLGADLVRYLDGKTISELNMICDGIEITEYESGETFTENGFNEKFENYVTFLANSLFCEYAYIINLDDNTVEFYIGFNKKPGGKGRYAEWKSDTSYVGDYYGVTLKKKLKLQKFLNGKIEVDEKVGFKLKKPMPF